MYQENIIMQNEFGFQARLASNFVKKASKYESDIRVLMDGHGYNAKSIMGLLSMGALRGDLLTIQAVGEDAYTAVKSLIEAMYNFEA